MGSFDPVVEGGSFQGVASPPTKEIQAHQSLSESYRSSEVRDSDIEAARIWIPGRASLGGTNRPRMRIATLTYQSNVTASIGLMWWPQSEQTNLENFTSGQVGGHFGSLLYGHTTSNSLGENVSIAVNAKDTNGFARNFDGLGSVGASASAYGGLYGIAITTLDSGPYYNIFLGHTDNAPAHRSGNATFKLDSFNGLYLAGVNSMPDGIGLTTDTYTATSETTTSDAFADLATFGPQNSFQVGQSGAVLVFFAAEMSNNTAGKGAACSVALLDNGGATVVAANLDWAAQFTSDVANAANRGASFHLFTGLTPGLYSALLRYRRTGAGGTATFLRRVVLAVPL